MKTLAGLMAVVFAVGFGGIGTAFGDDEPTGAPQDPSKVNLPESGDYDAAQEDIEARQDLENMANESQYEVVEMEPQDEEQVESSSETEEAKEPADKKDKDKETVIEVQGNLPPTAVSGNGTNLTPPPIVIKPGGNIPPKPKPINANGVVIVGKPPRPLNDPYVVVVTNKPGPDIKPIIQGAQNTPAQIIYLKPGETVTVVHPGSGISWTITNNNGRLEVTPKREPPPK